MLPLYSNDVKLYSDLISLQFDRFIKFVNSSPSTLLSQGITRNNLGSASPLRVGRVILPDHFKTLFTIALHT